MEPSPVGTAEAPRESEIKRIGSIATRPCKERKDGAPPVVELERERKPLGPSAGRVLNRSLAARASHRSKSATGAAAYSEKGGRKGGTAPDAPATGSYRLASPSAGSRRPASKKGLSRSSVELWIRRTGSHRAYRPRIFFPVPC